MILCIFLLLFVACFNDRPKRGLYAFMINDGIGIIIIRKNSLVYVKNVK